MTTPNSRLSVSYSAGRALGDYFTDMYFALPEESRRRWDRRRLIHHGALGHLITEGSRRLAEHVPGRLRPAVGAVETFGHGLADSDDHDRELWWNDGRFASAAMLLVAALERRR